MKKQTAQDETPDAHVRPERDTAADARQRARDRAGEEALPRKSGAPKGSGSSG